LVRPGLLEAQVAMVGRAEIHLFNQERKQSQPLPLVVAAVEDTTTHQMRLEQQQTQHMH
jgi:hypothetical protein